MKLLFIAILVGASLMLLSDSKAPPCDVQLLNEYLRRHGKTATLRQAGIMNSMIGIACMLTNGNTDQAKLILQNEEF